MSKCKIKDDDFLKIILYPRGTFALPRKGIYNLYSEHDDFTMKKYRLRKYILNEDMINRANEVISEYDNNKRHTASEKTKFNRYKRMLRDHNDAIEELKKIEAMPDGEWTYFLKTNDGNTYEITEKCYFELISILCINGDDKNVK